MPTTQAPTLIRIRVPERGEAAIPDDLWRRLQGEPSFVRLLAERRLRADHGASGVKLVGSCFVGQAICGDFLIDLHDKVPNVTETLLRTASGSDLSTSRLSRTITSDATVQGILVDCFLDEVFSYLSRHIRREYRTIAGKGSMVQGRLDVSKTASLWAGGMVHMAAFARNELTSDVPLNTVLYKCLRQIQRSSAAYTLSPAQVLRARQAAFLLSESASSSHDLSRSRATEMADGIRESGSESERSLALFAYALLSDSGLGTGPGSEDVVPRTWFLNLESLFERAVRRGMDQESGRAKVTKPRRGTRYLLPGSAMYSAEPDLLVERPGTSPLVGDVKYKEARLSPHADDVYQLLAHAGAYGAERCFLVYPGDSYSFDELGVTVGSVSMAVATVEIGDLIGSCRRLLRDLASVGREGSGIAGPTI